MSNIQTYLQQILDAVYGEEVRGSIHDAIAIMNSDLEAAIRDDLNPLAFKGNLGESGGTNNNLNNLNQTDQRGIWRLLGGTTYTNVPSDFINSKQAYLIMYAFGTSGSTATVIKQEIHYFSDSGANANVYWSRVYLSGEWQPWHKNVDDTLSIEGAAADAKAVGDLKDSLHNGAIPSISDLITPFFGKFVLEVGNLNTNTGAKDSTDGKRLISEFVYLTNGTVITSESFEFLLLQYNVNKEYIGVLGGTTWRRNFTVTSAGYYRLIVRLYSDGSASVEGKEKEAQDDINCDPTTSYLNYGSLKQIINASLKAIDTAITSTTYEDYLPDANSATKNVVYRLLGFTSGSTDIPSHLPKESWDSNWESATLITFGSINNEYAKTQLFITKYGVYYRNYGGGEWQSWVTTSYLPDVGYFPVSSYADTAISPANYQTILPIAGNAPTNTIYRLTGFEDGSINVPNGLPKGAWNGEWTNAMLATIGNKDSIYAKIQLFITKIGVYYRNYSGGEWYEWTSVTDNTNIIRVSALGTGDYTSFSEAIIAAFAVPNTTVYVDRGTYNIWDEMIAIMGNDYWDNLTSSTQYSYGLPWGNGMKIIGSPGAEIVFDGSQTDNDNAWYFFSPLMGRYVYGSDKTVSCEGLTFRVKNFRYAIHIDEGAMNINNDYTYIVRDCQFFCDNTENPRTKASDAIGMGASNNTTYIVENNYISSSYAPTARDHECIYFHNTDASSPKNKCRISNNYIDNVGTIRVDPYGDSANKCIVQINGNSCGEALILPQWATDNIYIIAWNNEIRTQ